MQVSAETCRGPLLHWIVLSSLICN